jgi:spore coat protein U-like protein
MNKASLKRSSVAFGAGLISLAVWGPMASAADGDTANLSVTATIIDNCTFSGATLAFGNIPAGVSGGEATTTVDVVCNGGSTVWTVTPDGGGNYNGVNRRMDAVLTSDLLSYQIYHTASHTDPIGDGTIVTGTPLSGTGTQSLTIYGLITGIQSVLGDYADTVVMTLNF